ncbi:PAT family beta-lactamase induction signal transducer AmpG [Ancylomarina subtilis]|uniref:PAT family beta-lactamase induction signal transducer AmpG n=1 Tax=Ancylomarina subtilis TaxID=1639035 RepID=A0A4Q7V9B1_9BACT|nr:MFS transporter [Ancylomarina subtilis]RZT91873.1 PAT family beta-lactamase induction signal transducer AmpG [Ancylomarina subtilis]
MSSTKTKQKHPATWIPTAYFAMGLPFVAIAQASVLMFKSFEVSDSLIAFWTSLIMLPWTLKPLWSPILEMFKTKKHFVVATQLVTGITFALVAISLPLEHFFSYSIALLAIVAFSGATHDIATDGVYLSVLSGKLQAKYIGWQGASYNIAKILTAGALVYLAGILEKHFGVLHAWMAVMLTYALIMISLALYHIRMLPSGGTASSEVQSLNEGFKTLWDVIRTFFQKKHIGWFIAFIIVYRFAEGFAVKIAPLFFKAAISEGGLGLSTSDIGLIYGVFGSGAFVLGSILAGYFIAARGLKKSLFTLVCVFNIQFVVYALLAIYRPTNLYLIGSAVVVEYFVYGFGFVGLMLFMMQQVAPGKYKMAHYAFATGIMNLGFMFPGMLSGFMSDWLGYKLFFICVLVAIIPALFAAKFVPFIHNDNPDIE